MTVFGNELIAEELMEKKQSWFKNKLRIWNLNEMTIYLKGINVLYKNFSRQKIA